MYHIYFIQVANLYYNHPILDVLSVAFKVTQKDAAIIPTVAQAGYATGLVFLCPLGDLVKRRLLALLLVLLTATMWLGLCLTKNFTVFVVLSFITSVTTITPVCPSVAVTSVIEIDELILEMTATHASTCGRTFSATSSRNCLFHCQLRAHAGNVDCSGTLWDYSDLLFLEKCLLDGVGPSESNFDLAVVVHA